MSMEDEDEDGTDHFPVVGAETTGNCVPQGISVANNGATVDITATGSYGGNPPNMTLSYTVDGNPYPAYAVSGNGVYEASHSFTPTKATSTETYDTFTLTPNPQLGVGHQIVITLTGSGGASVASPVP